MSSVKREISVWVRDGIVQANRLVNGTSKITNLSDSGASTPQIAINSLGDAIVVWSLSTAGASKIQYTYYTKLLINGRRHQTFQPVMQVLLK